MKFPDKKYNIIYADPPWKFKYYSKGVTEGNPKDIPYDDSRAPQNHYGCMTIDDIYKLPVQDISAEKLKVMEPVRLDRMSGYLSLGGFRDRATRDEMRHLAADIFKSYDNLGCSGHEYFRLVTDQKHFNINYRTYPWDHLPGCLIHSEAGGYQASFDGKSYLPTELTQGLIAVPNKLVWEEIRKHFLQSYLT